MIYAGALMHLCYLTFDAYVTVVLPEVVESVMVIILLNEYSSAIVCTGLVFIIIHNIHAINIYIIIFSM